METSILFKFKQRKRLIALLSLCGFLLSWVGVAQGMPLFLILMGHSHKVFLTKHSNTIEIVIHHPGNRDEHESPTGDRIEHQHDLLDRIIAATAGGKVSHSDHAIQLSDDKEQIIVTSATVSAPKTSPLEATVQLWPVVIKPAPFRIQTTPLVKANPKPVSLFSTVLLI